LHQTAYWVPDFVRYINRTWPAPHGIAISEFGFAEPFEQHKTVLGDILYDPIRRLRRGLQLAVLASVNHQHVATVLSLLYISGGIGGAIGNTVSGTIWTNTFEKGLARYLPQSAQANLTTIYASLPAQLAYPENSPERIGIQNAYGYAQTAVGGGLMGLSLIWICFIKNLNLSKLKQTKGVVL
jgi:hypothetical protein